MNAVHPLFEQQERYLPHNLQVEQALLGAILTSPRDAVPIVRGMVSVEDFHEPVHQRLYGLILDYDRKDTVPTPVLIAQALRGDPPIGDVPAAAYVGRLAMEATTVINAPDYARTVRNLSIARRVVEATDRLSEAMTGDGALDPFGSVSDAIAEFDELMALEHRRQVANGTIAEAIDEALQDAAARRDNKGAPTISWGIGTLDRMTGGLERGDLAIVAGRPGMGKTATLVACMMQAAKRGHGVVFFSLEMKKKQIGLRCACALASEWSSDPIDFFRVRTGRYTDNEMRRLREAWEQVRSYPIVIDASGGLTVSEMGARVRRYRDQMERKGQSLDIVMVDYLGILTPTRHFRDNKVAEITQISNDLKTLAMRQDVPVVSASQLSRAVEQRNDKRPVLSDLRESGSIEQDADIVLFPFREAYYLEKEVKRIEGMANASAADMERLQETKDHLGSCARSIEFIVEKQRQGPPDSAKAFADMATGIIGDLDDRHEDLRI